MPFKHSKQIGKTRKILWDGISPQRLEDGQVEDGADMFSDRRKGIFAIISNKDEEAKEIYLTYKERWDIEQSFDYLKIQ